MIEIRQSRLEDIEAIIPRLRAHDKKTVERLNIDAVRLLIDTYRNGSPMMTATENGAPVCMWGIEKKSLLSCWMIWMLTTDFVDRHPIRFLRSSRTIVRVWAESFGTIEGMVDTDFEVSIRWLRWLGFREIADGEYKKMRYP